MRRISGLLLVLWISTFAVAQSDRGIITGTVTDQTGAVVAGATVRAANIATNVESSTTTTSSGNFTIPSIPPGAYNVTMEAPGFKQFRRTNVVVTAGGTATANALLEVGQISETVSVESSAVTLQTETAKTFTAVSNRQVDELPLVVGGAMRGGI